ncbi:hypothetical protein CAEBREN_07291 [Caenorhabditis brenneri]|uniref:Uncharacterized protein n=1 Tax=Caenorhabditis brenneri TaxID=135651 RepID=G0MI61_CAEBE|nr:hypothetical protein CAEBREN_07291 [Caenorhabditis brenneri]
MEKNDGSSEPPRYVILKRSNDANLENPNGVSQGDQDVERAHDELDRDNEQRQLPHQLFIAKLERVRQRIDLFLNMNEAVMDQLLVVRHVFFELGLNAVFEDSENEEEDEVVDEDSDEEENDGNNDQVGNPAPAA